MYRHAGEPTDTGARPTAIRAAVYCRVSTDESLHLEFNSLDAQREACEAFVKSQQHEGWLLSPGRYDDGGFSGGTLIRPGLKRLLADIADGGIDVIVVYKIDRLSRSLADFVKIVDVLDQSKASFVSITQAFSTSTSMGRLTLNVLLSFAQFEREVGAERVRDKIAASKQKGMWMGGVCPLGYDVKERKLIANEPDAATVRSIFRLYLELGSVLLLETELIRRGTRSRLTTRSDGTVSGGKALTRGALYTMLQNRIYIGQICHRGTPYPGQHASIVDEGLFAEAQALLARNRVERKLGTDYQRVALLAGLVWDVNGRRMSPAHSTKGSARYRYYAAKAGLDGTKPLRVAAADLERIVINKLTSVLRSERDVHDILEKWTPDAVTLQAVLSAAKVSEQLLTSGTQRFARELLLKLLSHVQVLPDKVTIRIKQSALMELAGLSLPASPPAIDVGLAIACRMYRRTREVRLAIAPQGPPDTRAKDPALIKLLAKAWAAREAVMKGDGASLRELAADAACDLGYFTVLVKLGFLDPKIVAAVIEGQQPPELTRQRLARIRNLPIQWRDQRRLMNF